MLRDIVDKLRSSYAQAQIFPRKTEEEKFQQIVHKNYELDDVTCLLDLMNSVYAKVIANQSNCNLLEFEFATNYLLSIFFPFLAQSVGTFKITET